MLVRPLASCRTAGIRVADAMQVNRPTVEPGATVQQLLDQFIAKEFQRAYLVTLGDSFQGLVTVSDVLKVAPEDRVNRYVTEIMTRTAEVATVGPEAPLEDALQLLATRDVNQLVVVANGVPVGLLARRDIVRVLEISRVISGR